MTVFCLIMTHITAYALGVLTIGLVSNPSGYDKGFQDGYDLAKQDLL